MPNLAVEQTPEEWGNTLTMLVYLRDERYIGDMSDPIQMFMYRNNITNCAVDAAKQRMLEGKL